MGHSGPWWTTMVKLHVFISPEMRLILILFCGLAVHSVETIMLFAEIFSCSNWCKACISVCFYCICKILFPCHYEMIFKFKLCHFHAKRNGKGESTFLHVSINPLISTCFAIWNRMEYVLHGGDLTDFSGRTQLTDNFSTLQLQVELHTLKTTSSGLLQGHFNLCGCGLLIRQDRFLLLKPNFWNKTCESCYSVQFFRATLCAANVIVTVPWADYAACIVWLDNILFQQSVPLCKRLCLFVQVCVHIIYYLMRWVSVRLRVESRAEIAR